MKMNHKLLEILLDLHGKKRTGILRIQKDRDKRQLLLNSGLLVLAESNLPKEHLAWMMVTLNLLPRNKLDSVSSLMKEGKTSEEALLDLSECTLGDIEGGRRELALTIISSILVWDECEFCFYPGENLIRHRLNLQMQLPELIVVSVRQAIAKHLLNAPSHFVDHTFKISQDCIHNYFPLNEAESHVYSLLRAPVKAGVLMPAISAVVPKAEEVLLCLYLLGLISFHTDPVGGVSLKVPAEMDTDPLVQRVEEMLLRLDSASLYEVLSVGTDASQGEIQAAYHEQARQLHPDRFQTKGFSAEIRGKAEQVFARVNQAYMTLKNPASRILYDEQWAKQRAGATGPKIGAAQSAETAEALFREGKILLARGDVKTAVERLKGSVWLCPEKVAYHYYLGIAEALIPKLRKSAEQHLLKAIELGDFSPDSHLALAKLYIEVHLPKKAESHLQRVLAWDRANAEAQNLLSKLKKAQ
jgi:curved DNA-binding protein CbpA